VVPGVAAAVICTCSNSISSSSIGLCLAHPSAVPLPFELLQSKSTMPQPSVVLGFVKPVLLHGMMMVLAFIIQVCLSARGSTLLGQLAG